MGIQYLREGFDLLENVDQIERKENIIREKIKNHLLSNNLCFLLGSGCSVGAIQLMSKTFSELKNEKDFFKGDKRKEVLGKFEDDDNIEEYLNWLSKLIDIFPGDTTQYKKAFNITKEALVKSIKINYEHETKIDTLNHYNTLYKNIFENRVIANIDSPINIFTTNYDLFNEHALEKLKIHYFNGFVGGVNRRFSPDSFNLRIVDEKNRYKDKWSPIKKLVRLYKIHGSIDWDDTNQGIIQTQKRISTKNVIIYPTASKLFETQRTPYSELFREFSIKLQEKNTTLIIIGYGFSDSHVNSLISQALAKDDFTLIIFSDLKNNANIFYEAHKKLKNVHVITGNEGKSYAHYFSYIVNKFISSDKYDANGEDNK